MPTELRLLITIVPWLTTGLAIGYGLGLVTTFFVIGWRKEH